MLLRDASKPWNTKIMVLPFLCSLLERGLEVAFGVRPGFNLPPGDTIPEASGNGKLAGFRRKPLDTGRDVPSNSKTGYQSFPVGNRSKPDGKPCLPPEN